MISKSQIEETMNRTAVTFNPRKIMLICIANALLSTASSEHESNPPDNPFQYPQVSGLKPPCFSPENAINLLIKHPFFLFIAFCFLTFILGYSFISLKISCSSKAPEKPTNKKDSRSLRPEYNNLSSKKANQLSRKYSHLNQKTFD